MKTSSALAAANLYMAVSRFGPFVGVADANEATVGRTCHSSAYVAGHTFDAR
jgi:hypothetical protein